MSDPVSYFWMFVAAVIVLVDLWAIINILGSDKSDGVKVLWLLGIVIFPVLGLIVWGLFGPRGIKPGSGSGSPEHSK
ncbi:MULTISPECIES: PLD nuclease N-terminal domain-containing protein [Pseudomonas]|uniref:PLDc_N domain-containing protein n=1 Tax=Pseudomonas donghuensis TaxID=1163398 RepID=A0AAP0SGM3_9PSED|nr:MULTISPECIES: PLD nuclease N-terminal domain-containing protein [Pseudomonas]MDF9893528.1 hypothetical protein [Pseudomonas vranovensis]KDN98871.2 PLDc_N domain-containing protein [Pseudomonas donghuensis]MBF4209779.1 PLDc_N domain-containing protein [Pseudomonas donghuensis]MCP6694617.1 PLD nuclease N-terminal domain-containing protein [Pseudomonas donghuensis]PJY96073.1 hypothetical protein COO64_14805 [Pseudomonas donghuensis]